MDPTGDLALVGGVDGVAGVYSLSKQQVVQTLKAGGPVTDAVWAGNKAIVASATGAVKVFENGTEIANFTSHAGEVTALAVHPAGDIIGSVGVDKSYVLYDLTTSSPVTQIFSDSGKSPSPILLPLPLEYQADLICRLDLCEVPSGWTPLCRGRHGRADQDLRCQVGRCGGELPDVRSSDLS